MSDFSRFTMRVARKVRDCDVCGCAVSIGFAYSHGTHRFEGEFGETHRHVLCEDVLASILDNPYNMPHPGDMWDWRGFLDGDARRRAAAARILASATATDADVEARDWWRDVLDDGGESGIDWSAT